VSTVKSAGAVKVSNLVVHALVAVSSVLGSIKITIPMDLLVQPLSGRQLSSVMKMKMKDLLTTKTQSSCDE
jgi:hypothetical protein